MASRRTAPLSQQIADKLLADFRTGEKYGPGDKLPNENDLSEEYGISLFVCLFSNFKPSVLLYLVLTGCFLTWIQVSQEACR